TPRSVYTGVAAGDGVKFNPGVSTARSPTLAILLILRSSPLNAVTAKPTSFKLCSRLLAVITISLMPSEDCAVTSGAVKRVVKAEATATDNLYFLIEQISVYYSSFVCCAARGN